MNNHKKHILRLIIEINDRENYGGLIPLSVIYNEIVKNLTNSNSSLNLLDFKNLILEMEGNQEIYLEPINDSSRLTIEEKKIAINDKIRGDLFYVGCW